MGGAQGFSERRNWLIFSDGNRKLLVNTFGNSESDIRAEPEFFKNTSRKIGKNCLKIGISELHIKRGIGICANAFLAISEIQISNFSPNMVDSFDAFLFISEIQISKFSPTMVDSFNAFLVISEIQISKFSPTMMASF